MCGWRALWAEVWYERGEVDDYLIPVRLREIACDPYVARGKVLVSGLATKVCGTSSVTGVNQGGLKGGSSR